MHNCKVGVGVHYSEFGGFDYDGKYFGSFEEANERLRGGLVVCERLNDDRDGRLRLHKIYARSVQERKNGWYDLYTYTTKASDLLQGFYLCKINEFRGDKEGYVNMVVEPKVFLGMTITETPDNKAEQLTRAILLYDKEADIPAWEYLRREMSPIAFDPIFQYTGELNISNAEKLASRNEAMKRLLAGEVSILKDISIALAEPTSIEKAISICFRFYKWTAEQKNRWPSLLKKLERRAAPGENFFTESELTELLERKLRAFTEFGLISSNIEEPEPDKQILDKVEAAIQHQDELNKAAKKAQNEAKKAAKKAKKAALKNC